MSTTRIVVTNATRSLPVPNSKTFPMTGAVLSVARQRKVSVASRKKISIQARTLLGASFFIMSCTDPCRQGMQSTRYTGAFCWGKRGVCRTRIEKTLFCAALILVPDCAAIEVMRVVRANRCSVLRGPADCICHPCPSFGYPLSCPDRAAKRCLRSLTVLVSSKNTLFQQQTGAHEISTIPDHDLSARARRKA